MRSMLVLSSIVMLLSLTARADAQGSPCLANSDTASIHVAAVTRTVTFGDSARLTSQGIPYRPSGGVTLVTDSLSCRSAVNAYNSLDSTTANISSAYVMKVGTSVYALALPQGLYYYLDSSYRLLAAMGDMR